MQRKRGFTMNYLKELLEKRAELQDNMQAILDSAKTEKRAFSEDENTKFESYEKEITQIDATIKAEERARNVKTFKEPESKDLTKEQLEERAFANHIRGLVEERADVNLTVSANGAVIPASIANKIIQAVVDVCPIYQLATRYNVGGTLSIPTYDESTNAITMAYATEFTELSSTSGSFTSIQLSGYLAGALTLVSKSLLNNSNFNLTTFVVGKMAENISKFIEKELLKGTAGKVTGLSTVSQIKTTASATAITVDELMDTQDLIRDQFQGSSIWIMNRATRSAIRKLKDNDGNYLLNRDVSAKWGYTLLGKDVYCSDNMSVIGTGNTVAYYGDFSGLAVKVVEEVSIEILREKYATQHAIGVVAWVELDSKIENAQKISKLKMA